MQLFSAYFPVLHGAIHDAASSLEYTSTTQFTLCHLIFVLNRKSWLDPQTIMMCCAIQHFQSKECSSLTRSDGARLLDSGPELMYALVTVQNTYIVTGTNVKYKNYIQRCSKALLGRTFTLHLYSACDSTSESTSWTPQYCTIR